MAQHDYNLADQSRTNFRQDLNNALAAILSQNSGASAPATTAPYMPWADTTTGLLKIRNAADNAWIIIGTLASAYLGLADLATANAFTASQKLSGDALLLRFKDSGGSGVEWGIRSDGGNLELCENTGTEGTPVWTVRKVVTSNGILNPYIASAGTDTYTATYSPVIASLVDGTELEIEFVNASTAAATLNVNGLGAKKLYIESSGAYAQVGSGDIFAGMRTSISYKSSLDTGSGGWVIKNPKASTVGFSSTFAHGYRNAALSIDPTTVTNIPLDAEIVDNGNNLNTTTGKYIVPSTGIYEIQAGILFSVTFATDKVVQPYIYRNGALLMHSTWGTWSGSYGHAKTLDLAQLTAGDEIQLYVNQSDTGARVLEVGGGSYCYLKIIRVA